MFESDTERCPISKNTEDICHMALCEIAFTGSFFVTWKQNIAKHDLHEASKNSHYCHAISNIIYSKIKA